MSFSPKRKEEAGCLVFVWKVIIGVFVHYKMFGLIIIAINKKKKIEFVITKLIRHLTILKNLSSAC